MKIFSNQLLSRKQFLILGISTTTGFTILLLSEIKVLSYLIYLFKNDWSKIVDNKSRKFTIVGKSSLQQRAKSKGLIYGAFPQADHQEFVRDRQFQSNFIRECAMMTVGSFWFLIQPSPKIFDFTSTDYFGNFSITAGKER